MHEYEFGEGALSAALLVQLSQGPVRGRFSKAALVRLEQGRGIVEQALAAGAEVYGATTGIGSQKDVAVGAQQLSEFSNRMIVSEATLAPGTFFSDCIVRGALIVLCHNVAQGRCGVRVELALRLLELLASPRLPRVVRDTAFGVADLTPLSQLALPLIGRELFDDPAAAVRLGGRLQLAPKESVSLIDNNAFALSEAAQVMNDANDLLGAFDLAAALACEGFRAGIAPHREAAAGGYRGHGQARARANLLRLLSGSALQAPDAARFLQDPLSFRGITQVHGAAYEVLAWATQQVEIEINAATDNPLVDLEGARLLTSASMISVLPPMALDTLRQALAKVAVTSHERSLKLQSPPFSSLPVGLAADGAADGGVLSINLHYIGSARLGSLMAAAAPVSLTYIGHTADGVEDVSTLLPLAASQTAKVIDLAWQMAALEMIVAVWAIARRGLDTMALGAHLREIYERLVGDLHIGEEGVRIFDFAAICAKVRAPGFSDPGVTSPSSRDQAVNLSSLN